MFKASNLLVVIIMSWKSSKINIIQESVKKMNFAFGFSYECFNVSMLT